MHLYDHVYISSEINQQKIINLYLYYIKNIFYNLKINF